MKFSLIVPLLTLSTLSVAQQQQASHTQQSTCAAFKIKSADVTHFWQAWEHWKNQDAGDPKTLAGILQADYLDRATPGLKAFTPYRVQSAAHLAEVILKDPD